ncbi:NUDIX hydrolase [Oceanobacillus halophilus]|uniref:NUDIX hydrolase n=1 Tax=Oceanobacillus halophilus TaxID=930130 RepID=A0A495A0D3_9BACI|nr:NUDIX hydrolase [Oceanobacillus halophilus]RKQ32720.1 NUDIX hydrolase [Oceanobacillus halophilus]
MAAIPKPASTVVLIDDHFRVYLTKRPKTMKFMGGFHVFPGGAMEKEDYEINSKHVHTESQDESLSHAHYIAAARELFEEVGILLGTTMDGLPVQLPKEAEKKYRRQLLDDDISFNYLLEREKIHFDLQCLTYFGQIITPERSPIRFDTRFFLTKLPEGQKPDPDPTEIAEAFWISPKEALRLFQKKEIMLAPPTIVSLRKIMDYQSGGPLKMSVSEIELLELLKKR